jgi:hypothetical protein
MKRMIRKICASLVASCAALLWALSLGACDSGDCTPRQCDELVEDSSLTSNGREYTKCISCYSDGTCETVLKDDEGVEFYRCQDEPGASCLDSSVNTQFAYCEVQ